MVLCRCLECHEDVSSKASTCPHCGCPIDAEELTKKANEESAAKVNGCLLFLVLFFGLVLVLWAIGPTPE